MEDPRVPWDTPAVTASLRRCSRSPAQGLPERGNRQCSDALVPALSSSRTGSRALTLCAVTLALRHSLAPTRSPALSDSSSRTDDAPTCTKMWNT
eukprot:429399-Pleurochrysis_carterae.AAC.1